MGFSPGGSLFRTMIAGRQQLSLAINHLPSEARIPNLDVP